MALTTDIQAGDRFRFHGLTGQQPETWPSIGGTVEVSGISVTGELWLIRSDPDGDLLSGERVRYIDALALIEQGIWQALL